MSDERRTYLLDKARDLPDRPGVYLFIGSTTESLYIGKARSLRERVRNYFGNPAGLPPKIRRMMEEAVDLGFVLTDSEVEALLLENNLVKKQQPRYNTLLRDDKNFPYLKMTVQDEYPRVVVVRKAQLDGSLYFGPYLPASNARRAMKMVAKFFQVAICHERLDGSRPRPCLYYQLDQCMGPCAGLADKAAYRQAVQDARLFLEGRSRELKESLKQKMTAASDRREFELAAHYRDLIRTVDSFAQRQNIASVGLEQQDYFNFHREGGSVALEVFSMRRGLVQSRREFTFESVEEDDDAFLAAVLQLYYAETTDLPSQIYVPLAPAGAQLLEDWLSSAQGGHVTIRVPQRGVRARFLDLVKKNARLAFESRFRSPHTYGVEILDALQETLGLAETPYRIECFDISHVQGAETVASMVVWEGGRPKRSDYRRFRVKTVAGVDDFASMKEVVGRRYARLLKEGKQLPDLILIDGGAGQLGSALEAMTELGLVAVPMAALAKKEELLHLPGRAEPLAIDHHSPILHLVQRVRDEAHRFAVAYHRKLRSRRTITTSLVAIPGVGASTAKKLLTRFGSVEGVRAATAEELSAIVGRKRADAILSHLAARI